MKSLEKPGIEHIPFNLNRIINKILLFFTLFLTSFSTELERRDLRLAQSYFYRGYVEYQQGNYREALVYFSRALSADRDGYYGELSYLYTGMSYARLSYRTGNKEGILSAVAYLNMYPYYYKKPTYLSLQRDFIGESYLLAGYYHRAKDIYMNLYRTTSVKDYLLKFLYADALAGGYNPFLLTIIDSQNLTENRYLYYLISGFYAFNAGNYTQALFDLSEARNLNKHLDEEPEFLYRYAVSNFMEKKLKEAIFYFELLDRKDMYGKFRDSGNYYLALIYLTNENYTDAKQRIKNLLASGNIKAWLLLSQLWLFPDFLEKYKKDFGSYEKLLNTIAWRYINSIYSIPAVLGIYYYSVKQGRVLDKDLMSLKRLNLPQEISLDDIRVRTEPMVERLRNALSMVDPYKDRQANFLIELYRINPENYVLLFGYEKLARAVVYLGDLSLKDIPAKLDEPLKSFLTGQLLLLEGQPAGLKMIEATLDKLSDEDRLEALFIRSIYRKDVRGLEELLRQKLSDRLAPFVAPALLEVGDHHYESGNYQKAKEYYRRFLEVYKEENELFWFVAYRLAKASEATNDTETLNWVLQKARDKDNILSRAIIVLWGE